MSIAAIIVAAGRGTRVGGDVPKQWRILRGRTVAAWTLDVFLTSPHIQQIVLVLHSDDMDLAPGYDAYQNVKAVKGGADRAASVLAGLVALEGTNVTRVLIHDVARPLVDHAVIERVALAVGDTNGAAPAIPVSDALWRQNSDGDCDSIDRTNLFRAQTPQGFAYPAILSAHRAYRGTAVDDVQIARTAGIPITFVAGDERNLKITTEADYSRAEILMGTDMDIRVGNGFDVHRFGDGDSVILCGVSIPHSHALIGHSDADVAMHALTDAIYGAIADGDIGQHFPPSQDDWHGADSRIFLEHAMSRANQLGFTLSNADVTLICETPKIGPHAPKMAAKLAEITGVDPSRISVKATTSEGLGFTGRKEGIAANATATLVKA